MGNYLAINYRKGRGYSVTAASTNRFVSMSQTTLPAPSATPAKTISRTGASQRRDTVVTAILTGLLGVGLLAVGLVVGAAVLWLAMSVIM